MKLQGYVEVFNHAHNVTVSRSRHSTLSIFREKDEPVMLLQHPSNKRGQKYKVYGNNIEKVFVQFMYQGKVTIRFKEPSHELRFQNDPVALTSFLKFLRNSCGPGLSALPVIPANPKFTRLPPTKVVIDSMKDLVTLNTLSLNTERLEISKVKISEVPQCVGRLKKLNYLQVSNTHLSAIPSFLNFLPNLMELVLQNNCLHNADLRPLIESPNLMKNLRLLDLQHNKITVIPNDIHHLRALVTLKLDHNVLYTIPHTVSNMRTMRVLSVSDNYIISYPYTVRYLKNVSFDVSNNRHVFPGPLLIDTDWTQAIRNEGQLAVANNTRIHSLKELASRVLFVNRLDFTEYGLPVALQRHLQSFKTCKLCQNACFNEYFVFFECIPLRWCMAALISSMPCMTIHFYICSHKCLSRIYPRLSSRAKEGLRYVNYSQYCKSVM